ncbi:Ctr copper transporter family-domain-containing protein [Phlyctochytrium arcticum]|nr:Ctr copper transporter family-domain-containing protein [Phlyctochytrium arcticum]
MGKLRQNNVLQSLEMDHSEHMNHAGHHMPDVAATAAGTAHSSGVGGHSMSMVWNWSYDTTIIFESWRTDGLRSILLASILTYLATYFFEYYRTFRAERDRMLVVEMEGRNHIRTRRLQVQRALLHGLEFFVGYLLMMVFMSMNGFLCLSMVAGAISGFYVFQRSSLPPPKAAACH